MHWRAGNTEHTAPLGSPLLAADGIHNLIGGLAVAGSFLIDIHLGVTAWIVAAAHDIPQELGDGDQPSGSDQVEPGHSSTFRAGLLLLLSVTVLA